jgi:hypothetical protein
MQESFPHFPELLVHQELMNTEYNREEYVLAGIIYP